MAKSLNQEQLKELVSITAERLRIKYPSIIEKDYYVTHAIHALSGIENEYFNDPCTEIRQSLALLKHNPIWEERYQKFIETMVYDNTSIPEYENAIQILEGISEKIIKSLSLP